MATRAQDTFTDTDDVLLENHAISPTGTGWQVAIAKFFLIADNGVEADDVPPNVAKETTDITTANMKVTLDCTISDFKDTDGPTSCGPMSRLPSGNVSTSTNRDGFVALLEATGTQNDVFLYRMDNGSLTQLGTWAGAIANDTTVTIRLESDGNDHEVYVDGTLRIGPVTDTAYNTNQFAGVAGASTSSFFDNYLSEDIVAVGGANPKGPFGLPFHGPFGGPI